jgi:hypothetical protein
VRRLTCAAQLCVLAALPMTGSESGLALRVAVLLIEEERDGVEAGAMTALICATGSAELARQLERVDVAAARLHQVAHVEQDQRGQADGKHRRGEHELARQMKRVEHQQNGVGLGRAGHAAAQHVDGDARVFRVGSERVDAGQIDEREVFAADAGHEAHALLDGDAGVVGDFWRRPVSLLKSVDLPELGGPMRTTVLRALPAARLGRLKAGVSQQAFIARPRPVRGASSEAGSDWLGGGAGADADGCGGLVAEGDFHAVDAVDGGVAGGARRRA